MCFIYFIYSITNTTEIILFSNTLANSVILSQFWKLEDFILNTEQQKRSWALIFVEKTNKNKMFTLYFHASKFVKYKSIRQVTYECTFVLYIYIIYICIWIYGYLHMCVHMLDIRMYKYVYVNTNIFKLN